MTSRFLIGALALPLLAAPAATHAQPRPAAARPAAVIVLDDTALVDAGRTRRAAAAMDALGRTLAEVRAAAGAVSSGPGGLIVDLRDDASFVPGIARSIGEGRYDFDLPADDAKAAVALDATIADGLNGLARLGGPAVLAVIGRSAAASPERLAQLAARRAYARRGRTTIVWLDLEPGGCDSASARDSTALTEPDACGVVTDPSSVERVMRVAGEALRR